MGALPTRDTFARVGNAPTLAAPQYQERPLSIYIHVPFCQKRCMYCDFATFTGQDEQMPAYVAAVETEMQRRAGRLGRPPAQTVFLGGGTPSLLPPDLLARLLDAVRARFTLDPAAEITMECNPGTLDADKLRAIRAAGVNRLSFGVQSLNDDILRTIGRIHSAAEALDAFASARACGFENLSGDLIHALPGQDLSDWQDTLARLVALDLPHYSLYGLIPEEGTPLLRALQRGEIVIPDGDHAAEMYEWARDYMAARGYEHYEISNWAKPGWASRHNTAYWVQTSYLGFGVAAHGYYAGERRGNVRGLAGYLRRIEHGEDPAVSVEAIDADRARSDGMIMGLRLIAGIERAVYRRQHGADPVDLWPGELALLQAQGLLAVTPERIALTREAHLLGNYVWEHFL